MGGVCCNSSQNLLKLKEDQLLRHLINQITFNSFSAPIGQIFEKTQENRFKNISNTQIQYSGLRYVRQDTNQFYNILFYSLIKEKDDLNQITELAKKLQWQLYLKNQCIMENASRIKEQFIKITQEISRNKLFEFNYSDLNSRLPFYALGVIFMRNLIKSYLSEADKIQILDWNVKFDLQKEENLSKIAENLKLQITLFFIENNQVKVYGQNDSESKILIMVEDNGLSLGLPEQFFQLEKPSQFILQLYKATTHARKVAVEQQIFVSENFDCQQLIEEYDLTAQMFQKIKLGGFKRVRGDGNCFYTTIVYQYLDLIINKFNDQCFQDFLEIYQKLQFQLNHITIPGMTQNLQKSLKQMFLGIIYEIRGSQNRSKQLETEFSNPQGVFYALSIIYIKNLLYHLSELNQEHKELLGADALQQIRVWEEETDNIQVLLVILTLALKINLHFYFIDTENKSVDLQNYNEDAKEWNLYMIFSPGHYCIGLPKI